MITVYQSAREKIIQSIIKTEAKGNNSDYKKALLNQVENIIYGLNKDALNWSQDTLPRYYKQGIEETNKQLKKMGVIPSVNASFAKVHELAVETVVKNTSDKLIDANLFIGRQINDNIRQAGLEAVQEKFTTGLTVRETKDFLVNSLLESGLGGIKDKLGRVMQIESYAQMIARSTTREATNRATMNQLIALGYDLVQMSEHGSPCPLCAPLEGRVYSISGEDKRFPALDIAYDGDYANIHPNCAHVLTPYIEDFVDNLKEDIANSNRPFEIDERAKQQIESYNKIQAVKTELRNDRKLYEKYKIVLGEDAPKSFSGFRKMKGSDSENWQNIKQIYKQKSQVLKGGS